MADNKTSAFLRLIRHSQRGKLKVYLGYCAGVGKTYQMLLEGHRLKSEGIDVVVGLVETHDRPETARLIEGLEVVPRLRQEYRGITVEEMDTEAVIALKPQVALVDEMAHTNVPGSRNAKRYQDIEDLLSVGIHVITTMNVQHLESLYDTIEKSIQVKVRERIPDSVLTQADQIVNIDLATEDLQQRLQEGKIYPRSRIETALGNFFITSNLEQLRELTLRELASQIDYRRREPLEEDATIAPDQIMVCLSSNGPNSEMLLRYASRLAGKLNRNWYAVYVQTPREDPLAIDSSVQRQLAGTLTLAKQLGAMVFTYKGEDVPDTILRFAREYRVGHIVIGSPKPLSLWEKIVNRKTIVQRLTETTRGMTLVVFDTRKGETAVQKAGAEPEVNRPAAAPPAPAASPTLSSMVSAERIVLWEHAVTKQEIIERLVKASCAGIDAGCEQILAEVLEREKQGSTFFNESVAFPHARIEGISGPVLAIGITRQGVADIKTDKPIECIFLILTPAQDPSAHVQILGLAAEAARNRHLLQMLSGASDGEAVLSVIRNWEQAQKLR
jgi:two-component system, OmpR family, sensor histidine kinase KdpD